MPIKKKEEVCGKPNQYNLQTLEYEWKELPDSHIQVAPQQPRIRNYSIAQPAAGGGVGASRLNSIRHQPAMRDGGGPAYTPLPSPSKPRQEELRAAAPQGRYGAARRDNVGDLLGGAAPPSPAYAQAHSPSLLPSPPLPYQPDLQPPPAPLNPSLLGVYAGLPSPSCQTPPSNGDGGYGYGYGFVGPPPPAAVQQDGPAVIPWSHDDIRRVVTSNALEAQRSYLR